MFQDGYTVLMKAVMNNHAGIVNSLLEAGVEINVKNNVSAPLCRECCGFIYVCV